MRRTARAGAGPWQDRETMIPKLADFGLARCGLGALCGNGDTVTTAICRHCDYSKNCVDIPVQTYSIQRSCFWTVFTYHSLQGLLRRKESMFVCVCVSVCRVAAEQHDWWRHVNGVSREAVIHGMFVDLE